MKTKSKKNHRNGSHRLPLWFWVALVCFSVLTLTSVSLNLAKNTRLFDQARENQAPLRQLRNTLLQSSTAIHSNWLKTLNPLAKKVQGDLVWDSETQKGVMRFVDLPEINQGQFYHLWVYDLEHSVKEPISATRFKSEPLMEDEYLVGIHPIQLVTKPYKFILTLETQSEEEDQVLLLAQP